jgi:restriction system protein
MAFLQFLWEMVLFIGQLYGALWPLAALLVFMLLVKAGVYLRRRRRYAKAGIADIDYFNGKEFEQYLEVLFQKLGYHVRRTPYQGDFGADLVLQRGGEKTVVQAKRYNRRVGVKAVQEAVASKDYYRCDKAMVVTNSFFSRQAEALAKANRVELWDRDTLASRIIVSKQASILEFAAETESVHSELREVQPTTPTVTAPTCAKCGKPVSAKVHEYCMTHADVFHGRTYCFAHQKELRNGYMAHEKARPQLY